MCALGAVVLVAAAPPLFALRANMTRDLKRLEQMGHYEQVVYYRKSSMDMVTALHARLSGIAFDPQMDGVYRELDRLFGNGQRTRHQLVETRVDRRYWNVVDGQRRALVDLLAKAKLTPVLSQRLDTRVRVYLEDHMAPEFDEMGNFFFQRKAWIFERAGLFWDASFRRRLTGHYELRVCVPYYATIADEAAAQGDRTLAAAYRRKAEWYREEAVRELRRSNGDRLLSELQQGHRRERLTHDQVVTLLEKGIASTESDARFAAALVLGDLGQLDALKPLAADPDADVRAAVATWLAPPSAPGLQPGIRVDYFTRPGQKKPVASRTLARVDSGFRGNGRFPDLLRPHWEKDEAFPPNARGPFLLRFRGRIRLPKAGRCRLYVKTELGNRATVRVGDASSSLATVISPRNDSKLLYADQANWKGGRLYRIDFSEPVVLKDGLAHLEIDYQGGQAHGKFGSAGIRLYWSSEDRVMELVPATAFFHEP